MMEKITQLYKIFKENPKVTTDSRTIVPGSIFFAIKGETFNGNKFAMESLRKGAILAVVDQDFHEDDNRLFRVKNVLKTLQELATFHRQKLGLKILAITGSNGKTTTKELIQRVLLKKFKSHATEGNLNNHIGVPLTLLSLTTDHQIAVIEMGANHPGEIAVLSEIAQPDYGIITNVGKAHLEGFGSFEGVVKAKTELYSYLRKSNGKVFINSDNDRLLKAAQGISSYSYGSMNADCVGKIIGIHPYIALECDINGQTIPIQTKLIGKYNFENVMAAVGIGSYFKISPVDIKEAIESYEPSNNRSQIIQTPNNTVILDAYNANPSSMVAAVENFAESNFTNKVLILGDMAELGIDSEKEHLGLIESLQYANIQETILVGPIFHKVSKNKFFTSFDSIDHLAEHIKTHPLKNCTILLKASRKMQLEKIVNLL